MMLVHMINLWKKLLAYFTEVEIVGKTSSKKSVEGKILH